MQKNEPVNLVESELMNRHVLIEITKRCNLNCRHCFTSAGKAIEGELKIGEWKLVAKDLIDSGFNAFTLSGGEPLLEMEKTFSLAKEIKLLDSKSKVYLFTNGKLIDEKVAIQIKNIFDGVMISLDGSQKDHNWLRRNNTCYNDVLSALAVFKKLEIPVSIQSMVLDKNIGGISKLIKTAEKYSVKAIRFSHVDLFGRAREFENQLITGNNLLSRLDSKIKKMSKLTDVYLTSNLVSKVNMLKNPAKFKQPALHILANGSVLPWYGFTKKYELFQYPEKKISVMSLDEIKEKLAPFNGLLDLAEKEVKSSEDNILGFDNILASYMFNKKGGKNGKV